jgi:hypothetical protein
MRTRNTLMVYYPKQVTSATTLSGAVVVPDRRVAHRLIRAGYTIYTFNAAGTYEPQLGPYKRAYARGLNA